MKNQINIAELLKDCPKGMELDCTMWENCTFDEIQDVGYINIVIKTPNGYKSLDKNGRYSRHEDSAKCVIFPKGKTTWEGFVPPYEFEDGDIVAYDNNRGGSEVFIFKNKKEGSTCSECYLFLDEDGELYIEDCMYYVTRFATEEEKQILFDSIKANGYHWNEETKTLEKLINKNKFVIGATVTNGKIKGKISLRDGDSYVLEDGTYIFFNEVHNWELVPDKFDVTTLKPFDKVLVRDNNEQFWTCDWFSFHDIKQVYPFACVGHYVSQCIPFVGNEHLRGTTDDCDEYYKTWE